MLTARRRVFLTNATRSAALVAIAALIFWPALRAFLIDDDFVLVAFARILRNPLALFAHEHFSLGPYFRPLSLLVWWLTVQEFGNAIAPQYAVNLLLHIAVSVAFWRLLLAYTARPTISFALALLFAAHPIAIGTTLWLADRFDLLCSIFALTALRLACACRESVSATRMAATLILCACAVLSKETGLVAIAAIVVLWMFPASAGNSRTLRVAGILLALVAVAWSLWRAWVMHQVPGVLVYEHVPFLTLLWEGGGHWLSDFVQYLSGWGRLPTSGRVVLCVAVMSLSVALAMTLRGLGSSANVPDREWRARFVSAAAIVLLAGALQAPAVYSGRVDFSTAMDVQSIVCNSRLFYFPLCGFLLIIGLICSRFAITVRQPAVTASLSAACLLALGVWSVQAHTLANDFRRRTTEPRALMQQAAATVENTIHAQTNCQIYLLGIGTDKAQAMLKTMPDAVVKALIGDVTQIQHCLVQSEHTSWSNILGGSTLTPAQAFPLTALSSYGKPLPWLDVGGAQIVYLNLSTQTDARTIPGAIFLELRNGHFVDVSAQVRDGSRPVHFFCARAPWQC